MTKVSVSLGTDTSRAKSRRYWRDRQRRLHKIADLVIGTPELEQPGLRETWTSPCHGNPTLCGSRDWQQREALARDGLCCVDQLAHQAQESDQ